MEERMEAVATEETAEEAPTEEGRAAMECSEEEEGTEESGAGQ
jgi:hypothetical protein